MRKLILFIISLSHAIFLNAQQRDMVWALGYDCCFPHFTGINMDFRINNFNIAAVQRYFNVCETNGQICDTSGNFLFFSNGIYVCNANDDTMLNGSGLNPSDYTTGHSSTGLLIPQANLVLPMPGDNNKYYLIHETSDDRFATYATYFLYYSIIDMSLDNGLGGVVQKNTILLNDTLDEGMLTACKHANGRDWWFLAHRWRCDTMYEYLITPYGIEGPWIKDSMTWRNNYFGQAVFSPQGAKYVYFEPYGGLDLWDFDRCSGNFSNQVHVDLNDSGGAGGAAFSRSGRYLYIASINYVYQFDTWASNVANSKIRIATYDGFYDATGSPTVFYLMQLAPDNKIYIKSSSTVLNLHVINNPDSSWLNCDLQQHIIVLPGKTASLPNHVNYTLGPITGSVCDSLTSVGPPISNISSINLFPNPARNTLFFTQNKKELIKNINVYNSLGQKVGISYSSISKDEYIQMNISNLSSGVYIVEMLTEKEKVVKRFIKE